MLDKSYDTFFEKKNLIDDLSLSIDFRRIESIPFTR